MVSVGAEVRVSCGAWPFEEEYPRPIWPSLAVILRIAPELAVRPREAIVRLRLPPLPACAAKARVLVPLAKVSAPTVAEVSPSSRAE